MQRILLAVCIALLFAAPSTAGNGRNRWYRYVVHFTCGEALTLARVAPGEYTTAVHAMNLDTNAQIRARVALTDPPGDMVPTDVTSSAALPIDRDTAVEFDCSYLPTLALLYPELPTLPDFVQGFIVVDSSRALDVHVVRSMVDGTGAAHSETRAVPAQWMRAP